MRMGRIGRADGATLLARALIADAAASGVALCLRDWTSRPWASATFVGERHEGVLAIVPRPGPDAAAAAAAAAWVAAAGAAALTVRGQIVADLVATRRPDGQVAIEALTLLEA